MTARRSPPRTSIASIKRWGAKDGVGQRLMGYVTALEAVDDKTFKMVLREPYGMVLESLGKSGSSIAAIMREKEAQTDPQQQVKESIGSGPFIFAKDQWVPGSKAVYLKNKDYVPRAASRRRPSPAARSPASTASSWSGSPIRRRRCRRWSTARSTSTRTPPSTSCRCSRRPRASS